MDDKRTKMYHNYLLNLLDNPLSNKIINDELKVNLYLLLFTLNNNYYNHSFFQNELIIVNDFMRRVNNLKLKISLNCSDKEIDSFIDEIIKIYKNNCNIIERYNIEKLDIIEILKSKDKLLITSLYDSIVGLKMHLIDRVKVYHDILLTNNEIKNYYLEGNKIIINGNAIEIDDFYLMYSYLLDINNYQMSFLNDNSNNFHKVLIGNIIDLIKFDKTLSNEIIISLVLNYLLSYNVLTYNDINMSCFKIDNIKINDLYTFAKQGLNNGDTNNAKWQNVIIPNEYIYNKIKQISSKGMYYFIDDLCIIENNTNDFKISIGIEEMKDYLRANLLSII